MKIRAGQGKWIFKQALRADLAPAVLARPKQGFAVPVDTWMREPLRDIFREVVLSPRSPGAHLLNRTQVAQMFREHDLGQQRHGTAMWALLVLSHWAGRYLRSVPKISEPTYPLVAEVVAGSL